MALQTRRNDPVVYADAIRSIALEELDGQDTQKRSQWLAGRVGVSVDAVRIQVDEMVELLAH
jgi:hypothetical protein